ncbi:MAG: glycosyltransferase family 2 protein [Planctomycetota bacterium]|jgi:glycosyltransferase involved in cell wall biosynthesis
MILDLIIPALDEEANIDALFDGLEPFRGDGAGRPRLRNVILADNGSADRTPGLAAKRRAVVVHEPQRGYGAACIKALDWIRQKDDPPDVVVFLDADLSDDPAALPDLLAPLERGVAEIVLGARRARAEPGALNLVQRFGNGLACGLMRVLGGRGYTDLGPFRAARWTTLQRLRMADRTWGWTVELQMKAALLDIPTVEVDVPYRRRREGRSKVSGTIRGVIAAGTKIIATIVSLWWRRGRIRRTCD